MIINKLLSIKNSNSYFVYNIAIDYEKMSDLINEIEENYGTKHTDIIKTTLRNLKPVSDGKYDFDKNVRQINYLGVYESKSDKQSEDYYKSLGGRIKEWSFLTEEEKSLFLPAGETEEAKIKVEVIYKSLLAKLIKETFLSDDYNKCLIDGTNLIKLYNLVKYQENSFIFDKTIDVKIDSSFNSKTSGFFSARDYNLFLNRQSRNLNTNNLEINEKELNKIRKDFSEILRKLQSTLYCEQVGMFPSNLELPYEFEVLKRFGIRNESFVYLDDKLDLASIDYDGGAVILELKDKITTYYDLDLMKKEDSILNKIDKNKKQIDHLASILSFESLKEKKTEEKLKEVELQKTKTA